MSRAGGLTLLATSDLHGERVPELPALVAAAPGPVLHVDNGDTFGGLAGLEYALATAPRTCRTLSWLGRVGTAALNLGNHDLDAGPSALAERAAQGAVPLVSGNLRLDGTAPLPATVVRETPAGTVGIAGALSAGAQAMWAPSLQRRTALSDPVPALVSACRDLREAGCEWVVALGHFGLPLPPLDLRHPERLPENPGDALVAELSARPDGGRPLADVVVLGHTHVIHAAVQDRTAVVVPGRRGEGVARVRLPASNGPGASPPEAEFVPLPGTAEQRLARAEGPVAALLRDEREALAALAAEPLPVPPGAETFAQQLQAVAAAQLGATGLFVAARIAPDGPPARTVGEAQARSPMLEPLVVLQVEREDLSEIRRHRAWHAAEQHREPDPRLAHRHAWHAFAEIGVRDAARQTLAVPASWAGGYGGYSALAGCREVADPGWSLVELLRKGQRKER